MASGFFERIFFKLSSIYTILHYSLTILVYVFNSLFLSVASAFCSVCLWVRFSHKWDWSNRVFLNIGPVISEWGIFQSQVHSHSYPKWKIWFCNIFKYLPSFRKAFCLSYSSLCPDFSSFYCHVLNCSSNFQSSFHSLRHMSVLSRLIKSLMKCRAIWRDTLTTTNTGDQVCLQRSSFQLAVSLWC